MATPKKQTPAKVMARNKSKATVKKVGKAVKKEVQHLLNRKKAVKGKRSGAAKKRAPKKGAGSKK
jgi:hypothetical protein